MCVLVRGLSAEGEEEMWDEWRELTSSMGVYRRVELVCHHAGYACKPWSSSSARAVCRYSYGITRAARQRFSRSHLFRRHVRFNTETTSHPTLAFVASLQTRRRGRHLRTVRPRRSTTRSQTCQTLCAVVHLRRAGQGTETTGGVAREGGCRTRRGETQGKGKEGENAPLGGAGGPFPQGGGGYASLLLPFI